MSISILKNNAVLEVRGAPDDADMSVIVLDSVVAQSTSVATFVIHEGSPENHSIVAAGQDHDPISILAISASPTTLS